MTSGTARTVEHLVQMEHVSVVEAAKMVAWSRATYYRHKSASRTTLHWASPLTTLGTPVAQRGATRSDLCIEPRIGRRTREHGSGLQVARKTTVTGPPPSESHRVGPCSRPPVPRSRLPVTPPVASTRPSSLPPGAPRRAENACREFAGKQAIASNLVRDTRRPLRLHLVGRVVSS